jgi:hypothetical protein
MRSNRKEVVNKIQEHIREYYEGIEDLKSDVEVQRQATTYHNFIKLVEGGSFLVYYTDIQDFLNGLGINPNNKEYSNEKSWELYKHLLARDGEKLIQQQEKGK